MAVWKCSACGEIAYSLEDCTAHVSAAHAESEGQVCKRMAYRCPVCGLVYGHWSDATNHGRRDHGLTKPTYEEIEAVTV